MVEEPVGAGGHLVPVDVDGAGLASFGRELVQVLLVLGPRAQLGAVDGLAAHAATAEFALEPLPPGAVARSAAAMISLQSLYSAQVGRQVARAPARRSDPEYFPSSLPSREQSRITASALAAADRGQRQRRQHGDQDQGCEKSRHSSSESDEGRAMRWRQPRGRPRWSDASNAIPRRFGGPRRAVSLRVLQAGAIAKPVNHAARTGSCAHARRWPRVAARRAVLDGVGGPLPCAVSHELDARRDSRSRRAGVVQQPAQPARDVRGIVAASVITEPSSPKYDSHARPASSTTGSPQASISPAISE